MNTGHQQSSSSAGIVSLAYRGGMAGGVGREA
jgi:hypothetical protein